MKRFAILISSSIKKESAKVILTKYKRGFMMWDSPLPALNRFYHHWLIKTLLWPMTQWNIGPVSAALDMHTVHCLLEVQERLQPSKQGCLRMRGVSNLQSI